MNRLVGIALFVAAQTCWATIPINTKVVEKSVVFIYPARADGEVDKDHPLGTGFLVGVPKRASDTSYLFLVTARHIVNPDWVFCPPDPQKIFLRFNKTKYDPEKDASGVDYVPLQLADAGRHFYMVSKDEKVDAAVIQLNVPSLPQAIYDYLPVELSDFADPDEIKMLAIGDSIVSAGLLPAATGVSRNYPIFKFGNISNIPTEPVWTKCQGMAPLRQETVWFIAANLVAGNSGSPVFYVPPGAGNTIIGAPIGRAVLIGLQSMSFDGADVAGMTPVGDLFRIIEDHAGSAKLDLSRGLQKR